MDTDAAREVEPVPDQSSYLASTLEEVAEAVFVVFPEDRKALLEAQRLELMAKALRRLRAQHGAKGLSGRSKLVTP